METFYEDKKNISLICAIVLILAISSCKNPFKKSTRETIFDRIVNIPPELVLDIPYLPPLCDEIPGLQKGYVPIKNGELYYEEEGQGIPMVLINGGPGGTHHGFHPYFSQLKDIARVIYYDQRGTGKSSADETGKTYTIAQAVEDLESLRKVLKIDKWVVLGWSYGGLLAQLYALKYPDHCAGLVLVAALPGLKHVVMKPSRQDMFISEEEKAAIKKIREDFISGQLTETQALYNAHLAGDWKRQSYYKPTKQEFIREALYEWKPSSKLRKRICYDLASIALDDKFNDFDIPTLIFESIWDLTFDTDKIEYIRKNHPHAQVEIFDKSGHYMFADEPKKFFVILRSFLKKIEQDNRFFGISCTLRRENE